MQHTADSAIEKFSTPVPMPEAPGVVSLQAQLQKTQPSMPLKSAHPKEELGDSGIRMLHGIITEEYNPQLQGIEGIKIFDEMRKSDGTVAAAIRAITLPIRRAEWFINPASDDPAHVEQANFAEHALFDWLDLTWDDILRQALNMVPLGVMVFEKVYGTKEHDGKTYVTLEKLAPRMPKSILMWELANGTFGIQQIRQDGILAQIPGSKLLIFVNEREGDNWWGVSMLRAAYKHWYYKNNFYKIDALAYERQGMGIPVINMPQGYTEDDEKKATKAMQNLRANEAAYLVLPPDYKAEFMNMGAHTTRDPEKSIDHHNKEILQSVLAQFLELGQGSSNHGSRALSQDHSDLFLKALEATANTIIDEFNKNLLPELIDLNFDNVDLYPVLDYSGIMKADAQAIGTAYAQLVTAGGITPTTDDEQYLRTVLGLPPRSQEDIQAENDDDPSSQELIDHADIEDVDVEDETPTTGDSQVEEAAGKAGKTKVNAKKKEAKQQAHEHVHLPRIFDDGKGFKSWRPLTFAEQKVNWPKIQTTMDEMQAAFSKDAQALLTTAKDKFMKKLQTAMEAGDTKAVAALEIQFVSDYKALIKKAMQDAYVYGKNNVSTEMGVQPPANTADTMAQLDLMAATSANKTAADLEAKAKTATANALKRDTSTLTALGAIDTALSKAIEKSVANTAGIIIGQSINSGRNDVFERNRGMIQSLQRSEVLDSHTCNFCLSMDGLVVSPDDTWAGTDVFHANCRGIWVEIMTDEQNPPDTTGVPANIGDYYGGQPNELIQPPRPIVRPGSPAADYVKKVQAAKKK